MSLPQVQQLVILTQVNCGECGGTYAINERYREKKAQDGGIWNCPYCRVGWGYANNNENAKLKKELELERKRKEWAQQDAKRERENREAAEHQARAQKAAKTRLRNRIKNGVCPCCTRHFENLQAHIATKHPDFVKQPTKE
jgi:hypothetical protein